MPDGVIVTVKLSVVPERLEELVAMLAAMFPVTQQKKGIPEYPASEKRNREQ